MSDLPILFRQIYESRSSNRQEEKAKQEVQRSSKPSSNLLSILSSYSKEKNQEVQQTSKPLSNLSSLLYSVQKAKQKEKKQESAGSSPSLKPSSNLSPFLYSVQKAKQEEKSELKDVAGNPITSREIVEKSKEAPLVMKQTGRVKWAINQLTYNEPRKVKPTSAYEKYGVKPDQSLYSKEKTKLEQQFETGKTTLSQLIQFKKDFPEYSKQYNTAISQIRSSKPDTSWGVDVDKSGTIEENEYFTRDVALQKFRETYDYEANKEFYQNIDKTIEQQRVGLANLLETKKTLELYEQAGYGLKKTDGLYEFTQLTPKETYKKVYGSERTDIYVAKQAMGLGIPALINWGIGRYGEYEQEEYARMLELHKQKGEDVWGYTGRFWTSPEAIESTWIPLATMGAGYAVKGLSAGYQVGSGLTAGGKVASAVSKFGTTTAGKMTATAIKTGMIGMGVVGGAQAGIGFANTPPEQLGTQVGHLISTSILAGGGYYLGGKAFSKYDVPLKTTESGQYIADARLVTEDIQVKVGGENIGRVRGYGKVTFEGIKPNTGRTYYFKMEGSGAGGKLIGENIQVSRSSGFFRDVVSNKITGAFEAYGKSTVPVEFGESGFKLVSEKFVSAAYGKSPQVYEGSGLKWLSKAYGISEEMNVGTGKLPIKVMGEFDVTPRIGVGTFESGLIKGKYFESGVSKLLTGFKKGKITIAEKPVTFLSNEKAMVSLVSKLEGWRTLPRGSAATTGTVLSEAVSSTLPSIMSTEGFVSPAFTVASATGAMSAISTFGISNAITTNQEVKEISKRDVSIATSITIPIQTIKTGHINEVIINPKLQSGLIPSTEVIAIPKIKSIVSSKPTQIIISKTETIQVPKTKSIVSSKIGTIQVPKTETIPITSTTPVAPITPPVTPPVTPKIFFPFNLDKLPAFGGDWGWEGYWSKTKKFRKSQIYNPFYGFTTVKKSKKKKAIKKPELDFGMDMLKKIGAI